LDGRTTDIQINNNIFLLNLLLLLLLFLLNQQQSTGGGGKKQTPSDKIVKEINTYTISIRFTTIMYSLIQWMIFQN